MPEPLKLGVNIDHVATLRQARGTMYPSVLKAASEVEHAGAHGLTVHLREDRRHILDADVRSLSETLQIPLNLEMATAPDIVDIALEVRPHEVCLVPERRDELTTEGGLDVVRNLDTLRPVVTQLMEAGILVSLFVDPVPDQLQASADLGAPIVELHTGAYCDAPKDALVRRLQDLLDGARQAHALGLQVNAGHGIHLGNLPGILKIPHLDTLNIGHSIIARAVFVGLQNAVREMLQGVSGYHGGIA